MHSASRSAVFPSTFVHDAPRNAANPRVVVHTAPQNAVVPSIFVQDAPENPITKHKREREREGIQGSGPKGHQTKQHSNPRDQENQSEYPTSIPEKPNKNQTQNQQSLGGLVTAGWRGPWAALPSWRVTPGDRGTEESEDPPTTGTAPGGAKHDNIPSTETDTPRGEPSSSPAF